MENKYYDCSTCCHRHLHFPDMDDLEISMQECLCDGEDYEKSERKEKYETECRSLSADFSPKTDF